MTIRELRLAREAPIVDGGVISMTPAEWHAIPDNPHQRDTALHAQKAMHLRVLHPVHRKVNMAVLPDGRRVKLDGHTRDYLWSRGEVQAPETLDVQVWLVASMEEAQRLYRTFDSRAALHTTRDDMFGASHALGFEHKSELLGSLMYVAAARVAYEELFGQIPARAIEVMDLLRYWKPELDLLDQCKPSRRRFPTAITAAALITFRRHGANAIDFWSAFAINGGVKMADEMDAVQALEERLKSNQGRLLARRDVHHMVAIVLSAFDRYRQGFYYTTTKNGGIKALGETAFQAWVVAAKNAARATR